MWVRFYPSIIKTIKFPWSRKKCTGTTQTARLEVVKGNKGECSNATSINRPSVDSGSTLPCLKVNHPNAPPTHGILRNGRWAEGAAEGSGRTRSGNERSVTFSLSRTLSWQQSMDDLAAELEEASECDNERSSQPEADSGSRQANDDEKVQPHEPGNKVAAQTRTGVDLTFELGDDALGRLLASFEKSRRRVSDLPAEKVSVDQGKREPKMRIINADDSQSYFERSRQQRSTGQVEFVCDKTEGKRP
eukprot:725939_1